MPRSRVDFEANEKWFAEALRSPEVQAMAEQAGQAALAAAQAGAEVDEGDYKDGLVIEHYEAKHRRTVRVVATDWKSLLIEARTGNLARALKAVRK